MRGYAEYEAWSKAIGDRVDHQDECSLDGTGCSAPFSTRIDLCPTGQHFADVEEAAHQRWRAARRGLAVL